MHSEVLILSMQLITKRKRDFEEHMKPRGPKLTDHLTHWEWSRTRTQLNRNRRTTNSEEETSRHPLHCFRACLSLFFWGGVVVVVFSLIGVSLVVVVAVRYSFLLFVLCPRFPCFRCGCLAHSLTQYRREK